MAAVSNTVRLGSAPQTIAQEHEQSLKNWGTAFAAEKNTMTDAINSYESAITAISATLFLRAINWSSQGNPSERDPLSERDADILIARLEKRLGIEDELGKLLPTRSYSAPKDLSVALRTKHLAELDAINRFINMEDSSFLPKLMAYRVQYFAYRGNLEQASKNWHLNDRDGAVRAQYCLDKLEQHEQQMLERVREIGWPEFQTASQSASDVVKQEPTESKSRGASASASVGRGAGTAPSVKASDDDFDSDAPSASADKEKIMKDLRGRGISFSLAKDLPDALAAVSYGFQSSPAEYPKRADDRPSLPAMPKAEPKAEPKKTASVAVAVSARVGAGVGAGAGAGGKKPNPLKAMFEAQAAKEKEKADADKAAAELLAKKKAEQATKERPKAAFNPQDAEEARLRYMAMFKSGKQDKA